MNQIDHPHCVLHSIDPNDYQLLERPTHRGREILAWAARLKSEDRTYYVKMNGVIIMAMNLGPDEWVVGPAIKEDERTHTDLGTFETLEDAIMFMKLSSESHDSLAMDVY